MGNHEAGRAMGRMAEMALKMRKNQTALALLDEICEPYRGADAEFEAVDPKKPGHVHPQYSHYTEPNGPLGILIAEAFSPAVDWKVLKQEAEKSGNEETIEEFYNSWYDKVESQFSARYEFC